MRLRVISIGRDRSGLFEPAVQEYAQRVRRIVPLDLVELKESDSREKEAAAVLAKIAPREVVVCLDERGKVLSSPELADKVKRWRDDAKDVVFLIGGDEGHAEEVRERADFTWSLSRLVLPHRLARVVVMEQIYRAFSIIRGEPYHK